MTNITIELPDNIDCEDLNDIMLHLNEIEDLISDIKWNNGEFGDSEEYVKVADVNEEDVNRSIGDTLKWQWMMDYCNLRNMDPSEHHVWITAEKAYNKTLSEEMAKSHMNGWSDKKKASMEEAAHEKTHNRVLDPYRTNPNDIEWGEWVMAWKQLNPIHCTIGRFDYKDENHQYIILVNGIPRTYEVIRRATSEEIDEVEAEGGY